MLWGGCCPSAPLPPPLPPSPPPPPFYPPPSYTLAYWSRLARRHIKYIFRTKGHHQILLLIVVLLRLTFRHFLWITWIESDFVFLKREIWEECVATDQTLGFFSSPSPDIILIWSSCKLISSGVFFDLMRNSIWYLGKSDNGKQKMNLLKRVSIWGEETDYKQTEEELPDRSIEPLITVGVVAGRWHINTKVGTKTDTNIKYKHK